MLVHAQACGVEAVWDGADIAAHPRGRLTPRTAPCPGHRIARAHTRASERHLFTHQIAYFRVRDVTIPETTFTRVTYTSALLRDR